MSIIKIEEIETEDYVYDVETDDKNYVCGTSKVVVKQSDSGYNKYAAVSDVKYGDSVMPYTPIMVRNPENGLIDFIEIQNLNESPWKPYDWFKPDDPERTDKQKCVTKYQAWDGESWTSIKKVIRHKVNKSVYEVVTDNGLVVVTEDHSLIDIDMNYIKPGKLDINTVLYSGYPDMKVKNTPNFENFPVKYDDQMAYAYGVYFSCNMMTTDGSFNIVCDDVYILNICKVVFERLNSGIKFVINKNTLRPVNVNNYINPKYFTLFNDKIPDEIFNNPEMYLPFLSGINQSRKCFTAHTQLLTAKLYYMLKNVGAEVYVNKLGLTLGYSLSIGSGNSSVIGRVKSFKKIRTDVDFVYDLETNAGRFQAGIGSMIVKNTDSIYALFKFPNQDTIDKETLLDMNWDTAFECCERISNTFIRPIDLEMEKIMWPLYLYGKKRYTCKIYERVYDKKTSTNSFKSHNDYKGIQVVRRDNCNLVQTISNPVLECLLDNNDIPGAISVVKEYTEKLFKKELDINEFVLSKSLKKSYPKENKNGRAMKPPGHFQLQQKMIKREVMDPPQAGDRIPFVYIKVADKNATGGERMESPQHVIDHPGECKIDNMFYLDKQLTSPMYTIFEVLVKNEDGLMFPRKITIDKKTGKKTTEISKECKHAINKLLFIDLVNKYNPEPNFMVKRVTKKAQKELESKQKNTLDYLLMKKN
jgi:hypothetical protein